MSKLRVAVLFGGVSSEYEVSLLSASSIIRNIPDCYEVVCIGITKKGRWLYYPGGVDEIESGKWIEHPDCVTAVLSPDRSHRGILKLLDDGSWGLLKIDCVFPVLHGKNGEDGTIQGLLELAGIPCVGCGTLSSAASMDKAVTHALLEREGIPMAKWALLTDLSRYEEEIPRLEDEIGYPMFVKPANAGSSVGVNKANDRDELKEAIRIAFAHDGKVLVEQTMTGAEVECAVLGNQDPQASIPGEIAPDTEFYDYEAKYILGTTALHIPARISETAAQKVRETAVKVFQAMGCAGLARVDFFVDGENVYVNELNTLPGFTSISMYPKLWDTCGVPYSALLGRLIELALERSDTEAE